MVGLPLTWGSGTLARRSTFSALSCVCMTCYLALVLRYRRLRARRMGHYVLCDVEVSACIPDCLGVSVRA